MPVSHPLQVITCVGRAAFARLYQPEARNPGDTPKYKMTLLIPKDTPAEDLADLKTSVQRAKEKKWGQSPPLRLSMPIQDGDAVDEKGPKFPYDSHAGHWVIKAASNVKPELVYLNKTPITNEADFYSGCYCRCVLQAHPYEGDTSKGVTFLLLIVQKYEDGEAFGATKITAQEALDDDVSTAAPADAFGPPGGDDDLPF